MERRGSDSVGTRWQRKITADTEAEQAEASRRRAAALQRQKCEAQTTQLHPRPMSVPSYGRQISPQQHCRRLRDSQNDLSELDATPSHRQHRPDQQPPTPHPSAMESGLDDNDPSSSYPVIHQLQVQIERQQGQIKELEKELGSTRSEAQRIRGEIGRIKNEHIRAVDNDDEEEVKKLKRQVESFRQLLRQAHEEEKVLEDELDKVKGEKLALTRRVDHLELEKVTLENNVARLQATTTPPTTAQQYASRGSEVAPSEAFPGTTAPYERHGNGSTGRSASGFTGPTLVSGRSKAYKLSVHRGERGAFSSSKIIKNFVSY
ncbi:MAG: hypothetical protein Q9166_008130 [cf. Caloplaca sp. 2 TL-2023]